VIADPSDYEWIGARIKSEGLGAITLKERKNLALKAFQHVCSYDAAISNYLASVNPEEKEESNGSAPVVIRHYKHEFELKYGVNPQQAPSAIYTIKGHQLPFKVLNGTPGYINLLDALNAWQLVKELKEATNLPAAASFKHVSPAGAAVAVPLTDEEKEIYEVGDKEITPQALAYLRARNADPMSSYGDFAALSDVVDEATAQLLKIEVSDGIIAPGFDEKALDILKQKKGGKYIVIQIDPKYKPTEIEFREVFGVVFSQKRNHALITEESMKNIVSQTKI